MTQTSERTARQDEVRQERRRRDDTTLDGGQALKLAIPPEIEKKLAEQGRTARWANDVGNRIHRLTKLDDWDRVDGVEPQPVVVDRAKGVTAQAILLSKPIEFVNDDRRKKDAVRIQTEQAMLEGAVPSNAGSGDAPATALPDNFYADKANKIERANKIT
jgi:hypothetical protein